MDSSDEEQEHPLGAHAPVAMGAGASLKPQMDDIFAELEKNLPSIADFDMSDVSSDSEEPIIFHRNLKMTELDYDDEKDMDTSLSGEFVTKDSGKSALGFFPSPVNKNNASSSSSSPTLTFDNDLAALLAACEGHTEEEEREQVGSWKDLERLTLREKQKKTTSTTTTTTPPTSTNDSQPTETHDNATVQSITASRSTSSESDSITAALSNPANFSSFSSTSSTSSLPSSILEAGNLILAQLAENERMNNRQAFGMGRTANSAKKNVSSWAGTSTDTVDPVKRGVTAEEGESGGVTSAPNYGRSSAGRQVSNASVSTRDEDDEDDEDDENEEDSNKEVERIMQNHEKSRERQKEKKQRGREEQRKKEKDLALSYMSSKAPHLSTQILDSIDWESPTLNENAATVPWRRPPPQLTSQRPLPRPSTTTTTTTTTTPITTTRTITTTSTGVSASASSAPPSQGEGDASSQSDSENLTLIQKLAQFSLQQSGRSASMNNINPHTGAMVEVIDAAQTSSSSASSSSTSSSTSAQPSQAGKRAESTAVSSGGGDRRSSDDAKASAHTSSSAPSQPSKAMSAMLDTLSKLKPEPQTVFLDLRGFQQHREEEKNNMATVSRVLGLPSDRSTSKEDSSDSEDEGKWMSQRQQIKRSLTSRGTSTPTSTSVKQQRLQPTRVTNLQNRTSPPNSSAAVSSGVSAAMGAVATATQRSGVASKDSNIEREEEERSREREKEKERQREAARLAREEKERVRSGRLRMLGHMEGLRSTAAVSETKPCAENTPVLFDLEASYEPRLPVLPPALEGEELLLLTVNLSGSGEIALHSARSVKTSTETVINALPKSYLSLLCWLISLIPPDVTQLRYWLDHPEEATNHYPPGFPPFHVVGLQQLLIDGALCLCVVVCPSPVFALHKDDRLDKLKKGKRGDDTSRFYKFVDTYISRNSLSSVECWPHYLGSDVTRETEGDRGGERQGEEDLEEYKTCLTFANPHLPFLGKPMSAYMQLHSDPKAAAQLFNKDVGFFWQTVDPQEPTYDHQWTHTGGENVPQNTLFLLSSQALFRPLVVYETLLHVVSQSLDISGLRVLFPVTPGDSNKHPQSSSTATPTHHPTTTSSTNAATSTANAASTHTPNSTAASTAATPVLAVAVRGPHARVRLISIVGPSDFSLARKTDPLSLTAKFGKPTVGLQIYCPRNVERARSELARWFGGRVGEEQASLNAGLPYRMKEEQEGCSAGGSSGGGKGRRGKKGSGGTMDQLFEPKPSRPPASLTATTLGHVICVISPLVPLGMLGYLVSLMQQKAAFQPRGLRRLCLSVKKANTLGIPPAMHSLFCPGVNLDVADIDSGEHHQESCSPCLVLILERENASHHASSLAHILAKEMNNEEVLDLEVDYLHLFHITDYSDSVLTSLGGHFSKCPNFDPMCDIRGPLPPLFTPGEMEQVAVVILLGKDLIKDWGSFLQKLQSFSTTGSAASDFELLGVKWISSMNSFQTREVTPYEIGDGRWRASIRFLGHEPALILILRSLNAYKKLEPFVTLPISTPTPNSSTNLTPPASSSGSGPSTQNQSHPRRLMSRTPRDSYLWLRLFFWPHELFPDPDCRPLLPCLPESRLYYDCLISPGKEDHKPKTVLKPRESQDLRQENLADLLLCDPSPLVTFMLIKPRALRKHLGKVLRRILHEGFTVVGLRLEVMGEEAARRFLGADFENGGKVHDLHLQYLTSEPSLFLALWRENAVKKLRDLIGPEDPTQARRQSQFYWRGMYGVDPIHNGLYASRSYLESVWDLQTFFPDGLCCQNTYHLDMEQIPCPAVDSWTDVNFSHARHAVRRQSQSCDMGDLRSTVSDTEQRVHSLLLQTTCLVLPPDLMHVPEGSTEAPYVDILTLLLNRGFEMVGARLLWMTQHQAEQFLHIVQRGSFDNVSHMTSAPSLVLAMERDNAVLAFDNTLGSNSEAQSLLSKYGENILRPADIKQADQLLALFFDHLMPGSHVDITSLTTLSAAAP